MSRMAQGGEETFVEPQLPGQRNWLRSGFQSLTHFNQIFRSIVGETLSEYNRQRLPSASTQSPL